MSVYRCCQKERYQPFRSRCCKEESCVFMIEVDAPCWKYRSEVSSREKIVVCANCYKKTAKSEVVNVRMREFQGPGSPVVGIRRNEFTRITLNTEPLEREPVESCVLCNNIFHTMCVMHDVFNVETLYRMFFPTITQHFNIPFVCQGCMNGFRFHTNPISSDGYLFTAEMLTQTYLSKRMETDLTSYLFHTNPTGEALPPRIFVREVSSRMQEFEAKPRMKRELEINDRPSKWEYRQRSIMVFQDEPTSGKSITVFNLIVHEYPTTSSVNLAYIDSVKLFQPEGRRTEFFKRIVASYLKVVHQLFKTMHIWVCPPVCGDEYVFYGRPFEPASRRPRKLSGLINWYKDMLKICAIEGTIKGYMLADAKQNPYPNYLTMPYLKDDFWVDKMELILEQYEKDVQIFESAFSSTYKGKGRRTTVSPPMGIQERVNAVVKKDGNSLLFLIELNSNEHLLEHMETFEEAPQNLGQDILSQYMNTRDKFLANCRENDNDFADSRRGAFSTMMMLSNIAKESIRRNCSNQGCTAIVLTPGTYCYKCPDATAFCSPHCASTHEGHSDCLRPFMAPYYSFGPAIKRKHIVFHNLYLLLKEISDQVARLSFMSNDDPNINGTRVQIVSGNIIRHSHINGWFKGGYFPRDCGVCKKAWRCFCIHWKVCKFHNCGINTCPYLRGICEKCPTNIIRKMRQWPTTAVST